MADEVRAAKNATTWYASSFYLPSQPPRAAVKNKTFVLFRQMPAQRQGGFFS
jgi:hypothetical protein